MFCCIPLSIYEKTYDNNELFEFKIKEQNIYGSKRLGALQTDADIVEINQIFERQQDGTETQKIEYTEKQLKAEGLVIDPDNDAYWYDTHMQFEFKPEDSYKINVNFEIMDKTTNQSLTRLTRLEYINPTQPDTLYSILINLHYNEGIYKPELILTKAAQNGTYKQVHIQTNEGFKEWNFDLTYQIDIKNFEQNQLNVILFNHKSSYYLGKQLYMTTQTGNYVQNITDALNKLGDIAQNQIPVVAYNLAYRINKYEQKFVFKNSTENPVSQSGNITMRYTAIPTPYIEIAADTRIYYNQIGDKQYELSNHLGNVLEVVTDQKLLNVERGIPALTANFNNGYETYPFMPTQHLNKLTVENNMLWAYAINQNYYEQGTYADLHLQPNSTYLLKFEVVKFKIDNELLQVTIKNDNDALLKEIIKESGRYYYKFETNNQTDYQLFFTTYEKGHGSFVLDNIEVIEVADADLDNILQNSQNMAIFVPSVLSFNDYYPFGMLMPGRHANTDRYRYGFNGMEKDDEVKGVGNSIDFGARMLDTRLSRWFSTDPAFRKYPGLSTYNYVLNNPLIFIDPNGEDPIWGIFKGRVKLIGDDGKDNGKVYLVKGRVKRAVLRASRAGEIYKGSLADKKRVVKIPTRGVLQDVENSVNDTKRSGRENGGHALYGAEKAIRWDEGPPAKVYYKADYENREVKEMGAYADLKPFKIKGVESVPDDMSGIEFYWHTHPDVQVGTLKTQLGDSKPSEKGDIPSALRFEKKKFSGTTFVIGLHTKDVTFYTGKGSIMTIKYVDFIKMGRNVQPIKTPKMKAKIIKQEPKGL